MPIVYPAEEMEALETLECGCAILGWNENTVFDIEYCSIHEAAPALVEACQTALLYAKEHMPRLTDDDGWQLHQKLVDQIDAALAAARQPALRSPGEEASR